MKRDLPEGAPTSPTSAHATASDRVRAERVPVRAWDAFGVCPAAYVHPSMRRFLQSGLAA